jgi:hypothetical protein
MYIVTFLILFSLVTIGANEKNDRYVRKDFSHWSDFDKDCKNTRHEILKERSRIPVIMNRKNCKVVEGKWDDYYFPEIHTLAKNLDIDHLVPLKHAHDAGASAWTKKQKELFANDPENLVVTYKKYNREKGAKRIDEWLPLSKSYACKYIKDWVKVKNKYQLYITDKEKKTISLIKCK